MAGFVERLARSFNRAPALDRLGAMREKGAFRDDRDTGAAVADVVDAMEALDDFAGTAAQRRRDRRQAARARRTRWRARALRARHRDAAVAGRAPGRRLAEAGVPHGGAGAGGRRRARFGVGRVETAAIRRRRRASRAARQPARGGARARPWAVGGAARRTRSGTSPPRGGARRGVPRVRRRPRRSNARVHYRVSLPTRIGRIRATRRCGSPRRSRAPRTSPPRTTPRSPPGTGDVPRPPRRRAGSRRGRRRGFVDARAATRVVAGARRRLAAPMLAAARAFVKTPNRSRTRSHETHETKYRQGRLWGSWRRLSGSSPLLRAASRRAGDVRWWCLRAASLAPRTSPPPGAPPPRRDCRARAQRHAPGDPRRAGRRARDGVGVGAARGARARRRVGLAADGDAAGGVVERLLRRAGSGERPRSSSRSSSTPRASLRWKKRDDRSRERTTTTRERHEPRRRRCWRGRSGARRRATAPRRGADLKAATPEGARGTRRLRSGTSRARRAGGLRVPRAAGRDAALRVLRGVRARAGETSGARARRRQNRPSRRRRGRRRAARPGRAPRRARC